MNNYSVDLEIAKELKVKGFPQTSYLIYATPTWENGAYRVKGIPFIKHEIKELQFSDDISAPISDEILKELPTILELEESLFFLGINCLEGGYNAYYQTNCAAELIEIFDTKLSNALAQVWLYLKKEGYIK